LFDTVYDIEFVVPGALVDGDLDLRLVETVAADHARGFAPTYRFAMVRSGTETLMGGITLRVGFTQNMELFRGHIGFRVEEEFRGNRYALRSCRLLAPLARHHLLVPLWITCTDGNLASQKTLEALGAQFVDIRRVPDDFPYASYYPPEERCKRRYRWTP